ARLCAGLVYRRRIARARAVVRQRADPAHVLRCAGGGHLDGTRRDLPDRALPARSAAGGRRGPGTPRRDAPSPRARDGAGGIARVLHAGRAAGEYVWPFGGAPPVARIAPGTVLELFTEDCFAGRVRSTGDLVSEVIEFPFVNPQTGPFYVEGAEPGDTLAVH